MRLDRGPGSSLSDALLATSLKALTTVQSLTKLMTPAATYEPLCANYAVRTTLLVIMPTLDDVDITPVQRGDQAHGVVIPGLSCSAGSWWSRPRWWPASRPWRRPGRQRSGR
jgi:hypothetical protein